MFNFIKVIFQNKFVNDFLRNNLFNRNTPKGFILLVVAGVGSGFLDKEKAEFLIVLLANSNISYVDIYLFLLNFSIYSLFLMGIWLIFSKVRRNVNNNG